ncbi:TetR/AcrR family transcriptional regulator [Nonomuraea sp. NPDC050536]|uniref:TetR/AcrR family transcriptional regulator n=1 Tax=Nonomuraea sp. NPDC050536 TaxID=3364366 RepID=UPI0037C5E1D7
MTGPIAVPTNARSRRTRAALLSAARTLLEEHGPAAMTMGAAAELAGVSRRSVYLHFATRADLLVALYDHVYEAEGLTDSLRPVLDAPDPVTALQEFAAHLGRIRPRVRAVATAIQQQRRSDPDLAAHWDVVARDQRRLCHRLIEALHREGSLADSWTVAGATDMLWALMSNDLMDNLTIDCGWSIDRYADHLATLMRTTFVAETAPGHG